MFCGIQFSIFFPTLWPFLNTVDPTASASFFGFITAAFSVGQGLASPAFGYWMNRAKSVRQPLVFGISVMILSNIIFCFVEAFKEKERRWVMMVARFFIGVGAGTVGVMRAYASSWNDTGARRFRNMNGDGAVPSDASADRRAARKPRPEIQIYRPGMLRKGDSTKSLTNDERPPRPEKLQTTSEATSSSSNYSRRRSNDTDSITSRNGSGSTTPDANAMNDKGKRRFGAGAGVPNQQGYTYNSTQSLYDTRRQGGYTEYNRPNRERGDGGGGGGGRGPRYQNQHRQPFERPGNQSRGFNERASMRGDGAIAKRPSTGGGRRRNDSINSTQSEMPTSTNTQLHIDTTSDSVSQCGASSTFSMNSLGEAFSFEEMCQDVESFASMDWSKEVENEFAMREEEEERRKEQAAEELKRASNGSLQEANGQSHPPSRRARNRRNRRHDESDRESSFGGSIAEEQEEEEDELKSGERTPTSSRASIQPYNPRTMYQRTQKTNNENNGYNRRPNYNHKEHSNSNSNSNLYSEAVDVPQKKPTERVHRGGYRGEHDDRDGDDSAYEAIEHHMTSGRLAGRISIVKREVPNEEKNRVPYQKSQAQADGITKIIQKRSESRSKSPEMPDRETQNRIRKEQYEKNEAPRIREMTQKLEKLSAAVRKRDVKAAEKIVKISGDLARFYHNVILVDICYAYTKRFDEDMFNNAYCSCFQAMRTASNSTAIEAKLIRAKASKMLADGISIFEDLIGKYETNFKISLDDALPWPSGAPTADQFVNEPVQLPCGARKYERNTQKFALMSLAKILIALGDLYRYKTLMDGSENYDKAKSNYLKSALLYPKSGKPYNQLGVVFYYAMLYRSGRRARLVPVDVLSRQRQERVIDEFFHLARALACEFPFPMAGDRLPGRLDAIQKKIKLYQPKLDDELGIATASVDEARKALLAMVEIYIHPVTDATTSTTGKKLADNILSDIKKQPNAQLQRRAVTYLCGTFGLLVSNIGMENFLSVSDRAFGFLYASLSKPDTVFGAQQLAKLATLMIFALERNAKKPDNSSQRRSSVRALITFYMVLVDIFAGQKKPQLAMHISRRDLLILPAINVISTWLCHPDTQQLLKSCGRLTTLPSTLLTSVEVESVLQKMNGIETKLRDTCGELEDSEEVTYPENVLLSSFFTVFDAAPQKSRQSSKGGALENGRILMMLEALKVVERHSRDGQKTSTEAGGDEEEEDDESPRTRHMILNEEREKGHKALVVRPEHLIPDTNVFIGNLELVKQLLATKQFNILVPITVKEEIVSLAKEKRSSQRPDASEHDPERSPKARIALEWLQKEFHRKNDRLSALTSQGSKINGMGNENAEKLDDTNNDDVILNGALKYAANFSPRNSQFKKAIDELLADYEPANIHRKTCVLLTGDRGLTIKSIDRNLPCRSIEDFAEWYAIADQ